MSQRHEFVMLFEQEGVNRRELCRRCGISRPRISGQLSAVWSAAAMGFGPGTCRRRDGRVGWWRASQFRMGLAWVTQSLYSQAVTVLLLTTDPISIDRATVAKFLSG